MSDWIETGTTGDTWKPEKEGDTIQGVYKAKKENVGINESNIYVIQVEGVETTTGVWGSTVLDSRMEEVPIGSIVKIEFTGHEKGKGPKPYKTFRVWFKEAPLKEVVDEIFPE